MVRFFKKKYYLPLKWRMEKWSQAYGVAYPHPSVLQGKLVEMEALRLKAKQEGKDQDAVSIRAFMNGVKYVLEYGDLQREKDIQLGGPKGCQD